MFRRRFSFIRAFISVFMFFVKTSGKKLFFKTVRPQRKKRKVFFKIPLKMILFYVIMFGGYILYIVNFGQAGEVA